MPGFHPGDTGANPVVPSQSLSFVVLDDYQALVAQLEEQQPSKLPVAGSTPAGGVVFPRLSANVMPTWPN